MNRVTAALKLLLMKDANRVISVMKPEDWNLPDNASGEVADGPNVLALSAVWACINLLAGTQASLPLMPYRTAAKGARTVATDHPLYRVLHDSPNSLQTAVDFWEFICASIELWGNAYARKVRSGREIVGLIPVMPQLVQVTNLGNGRLRYRWSDQGQSYDLTNEDVLHIRGLGGNPLGGMSTLAFGARAFGLAIATDRAAGATFKNGLRPAGVLTFEKFLSKEQRDEVRETLAERFLGAMNAGRPLVLEGGTKWASLGMNPKDAEMLQSRAFNIEEICRFFGVPPFMIGHTEKTTSWGTGLEQQTLGFQKFALRRRLKRIEQALEKQLLTPEDRAAGVIIEFNIEGLLRGDSKARAAFYQSGLNNGWMTINEVRALENMPPVPGGDVPRMQSQNVPITAAPTALPAPQE